MKLLCGKKNRISFLIILKSQVTQNREKYFFFFFSQKIFVLYYTS